MKERIGFFGGCFNPPSKIHIKLATDLLLENRVDKIIFVPVGDFYKKDDLAEAKHRYNMLKLAVQDIENIEVDDIGIDANKKLYAADTFKLIEEKYKDSDRYFIMGSDNHEKMPNWKDYENIVNKYKYIVLTRNKDELSSTQIRKMIRLDIHPSKVLHEDVYLYIKENRLYRVGE
ncbi:MAG: nicotinate-nicotinamide nucleotide adenylyltransferase [Oscillospiraceae bacterium]|nr:nicotinate-nicotinamide nucleotide adenylyltransferase [Oscillospiraceae bacterium]